jgi:hypothetical protein
MTKKAAQVSTWIRGHVTFHAAFHLPLTVGTRVQFQSSGSGICGRLNGNGAGFSASTSRFLF